MKSGRERYASREICYSRGAGGGQDKKAVARRKQFFFLLLCCRSIIDGQELPEVTNIMDISRPLCSPMRKIFKGAATDLAFPESRCLVLRMLFNLSILYCKVPTKNLSSDAIFTPKVSIVTSLSQPNTSENMLKFGSASVSL